MKHSGLGFFLIALTFAAAWASAQTSSAVSGKVVNADGEALPGVTVVLRGGGGCSCKSCDDPETCLCCPNERVATTGSEGGFEFYGLEPGTYGATAELEGFASASAAVEVGAGETASVEIVLSAEDTEIIVTEAGR